MSHCYKIPEKINIKYNKLLIEKSKEEKEEQPILVN